MAMYFLKVWLWSMKPMLFLAEKTQELRIGVW